jgi:hypothetical protein
MHVCVSAYDCVFVCVSVYASGFARLRLAQCGDVLHIRKEHNDVAAKFKEKEVRQQYSAIPKLLCVSCTHTHILTHKHTPVPAVMAERSVMAGFGRKLSMDSSDDSSSLSLSSIAAYASTSSTCAYAGVAKIISCTMAIRLFHC